MPNWEAFRDYHKERMERAEAKIAEEKGTKPATASNPIREACAAAGKPELADDFLSRGLSTEQVRAELASDGWAERLKAAQSRP